MKPCSKVFDYFGSKFALPGTCHSRVVSAEDDRRTLCLEQGAANMFFCYIICPNSVGPSAGRSNNLISGATL